MYLYDFTDIKRMKMIEFQGDIYHANPSLFKPDDTPHPFKEGVTSEDIWEYDYQKLMTANNNGYELLSIWESDYNNNKNEIINKCLEFIGLN